MKHKPYPRMIEGVPYFRFVVTFRLLDGRKRRWVRWSPGARWVQNEVGRELDELFGPDGVREASCLVRMVHP